jgi:hypothetical protein
MTFIQQSLLLGYNPTPNPAEDGTCRGSCSSENGEEVCVFTMGVDIFASDLGGFYIEECGSDNIYPILGVEIGKTYRFVQEDRSNYYHPLGFAYHPDGAHVDKQEVEEMYLTYKLNANSIGLDGYEPLFFHSAGEINTIETPLMPLFLSLLNLTDIVNVCGSSLHCSSS